MLEANRSPAAGNGNVRSEKMLMPKRVKYRKQFRGRMRGIAKGGKELQQGAFGLQALEPGWITSRQIEAVRRAMVRAHAS